MSTETQWRFVLLTVIAISVSLVESKVYERCELAKTLHQRHHLDLSEVAKWVCIAQHSSGFNTAAQAFSNTGGSHGIFQISDVYWCSPPGQGAGCNLPCHKLRDDNLSDDLSCVKRIHQEHQKISGDGYNAWNAYQQFCKNNANSYIKDCFPQEHIATAYKAPSKSYNSYQGQFGGNSIQDFSAKKNGKVYGRCDLAQELYLKHKMPMQQIPTWVCIAEHESHFNTAAVGRLNADGSADHGIFQISDLYWCSHDRHGGGGKACGLSCNKLLDDDISDDVRCIKRIHNEHTAISGDGFNAWTVYKPYCQNQRYDHIAHCFKNTQQSSFHSGHSTSVASTTSSQYGFQNPFFKKVPSQTGSKTPHYSASSYNSIFKPSPSSSNHKGKIYTRCSLAQELFSKHKFPIQDISTWVCIAEHESQFNTAAIGRLNTDGSADHGLFQISDRYWCEHSPYGGKACNLACDKLLDEDLRDDVACIKTIHEEHTRLSGDGFNAWTVYKPHCQNQNLEQIRSCFDDKTLSSVNTNDPSPSYNAAVSSNKGKIYTKCELAQELYHKHHMPMEQIPKWVCIAQHESSFNTAAVGRLNTDGSADHGLFQISDLYWCSHDQYGGKACNVPCHKLLDSDITDDVRCIKIIHEEHTRISGDGFNAWTVYQPHCRNTGMDHVKQCFSEQELKKVSSTEPSFNSNSLVPQGSKPSPKGKIYKKCELAQELYHKHRMPMDQIPKWVCIAQHESSFNTAAVGRLNTDGSADHGLFQISDLYWCSHDQYGGKACNIPCNKLLDSDITDDVRCIKIIHEEHTRISGDGFNAWTVYKPHCRSIQMDHIQECFTEKELKDVQKTISPATSNALIPQTSYSSKPSPKGKIYKKCELAQELYHKHRMPMEQIPKWVCIAQHESSYNTAAVGRLNTDGSADHGLFQISDLYWCSHDQYGGKACNIPCDKLLDSDITDDVRCIKIIHEEHTRISGDGFNAWTVYKPHCRSIQMNHIQECFTEKELKDVQKTISPATSNALIPQTSYSSKPSPKGKIYKKCELAQELYHKHRMPMDQIPKWVCIAQHESSYNTAAVGRLNTDGSADHGLFQISDLYWCSHDQYGGKACNIPCDKLLDSDITDDIRCIKIIHEEHTRISGDGFNAWTVYQPHCRNTQMNHIQECFTEKELNQSNSPSPSFNTNYLQPSYTPTNTKTPKGKIYKKCELAQELLSKHKMPMEQIPTWVCIAQHESSFNTAAVGRLNTDGSADHGLFQISDLYWCTHDQYGGKACNIPCDKLLDSDITDDVRCIKIIHEEHTRISGDGFNAWTVYKPHCHNRKMEEIRSCFSPNQIEEYDMAHVGSNKINTFHQESLKTSYSHNPFLSGSPKPQQPQSTQKPFSQQDFKFTSSNEKPNYATNPFLQNVKTGSNNEVHKSSAQNLANQQNNKFTSFNEKPNYANNPFLQNVKPGSNAPIHKSPASFSSNQQTGQQKLEVTSKPNYNSNPFLNGGFSSNTNKNIISKPAAIKNEVDSYKSNPFLSGLSSSSKPALTTFVSKNEAIKNYQDANNFRTTTTVKPKPSTLQVDTIKNNPYLSGLSSSSKPSPTTFVSKFDANKNYQDTNNFRTTTTLKSKPSTLQVDSIKNNPFLGGHASSPRPSPLTFVSKAETNKNYQDSNNFRTSTTVRQTTTTAKTTTRATTAVKPQTSTSRPATTSWTTLRTTTTPKPKTTAAKPVILTTTTTRKPSTSWNSYNTIKSASTTRKPTTTQKTTTAKPNAQRFSLNTSTTKNSLVSNTATTKKLLATTTKKPLTTTTKKPLTTTTKEPLTITTRKPLTTTTKTPSTTTSKKPLTTTTKKPLTTTTKKPLSSTAKPPKSTTTWSSPAPKSTTTWDKLKYQASTTTKTPPISTTTKANTKSTQATTTNQKYPSFSTTKPPQATTTWSWQHNKLNSNATLLQTTKFSTFTATTAKPERTTWNWRNQEKSSSTEKPSTTTENWRKWDKTTSKTTTNKPTTTTTRKPTTTTTTRKPTTTTLRTTKATTVKPTNLNTKPKTNSQNFNNNYKISTTLRPQTTTRTTRTSTTTTTLKPLTTNSLGNAQYNKKDPFSHPFFAKVNEQLKQLKGNTTTTTTKPFGYQATKLQNFAESSLYQDFKNITGNKTKTIVAYNFDQSKFSTTTKRPRY